MSCKPTYQKTNDTVLQGYFTRLFKVKEGRTLTDTLTDIDRVNDTLPFLLADMVVMKERLPVIPAMLSPKRSSLFDQVMSETQGTPVLWVDSILSGTDSVYVAMSGESAGVTAAAGVWLGCMPEKRKNLLVATLKSGTCVLAAKLEDFTR